ncbi:MAG: hypothetical protein ACKVUS_14770 [Saprospiraceae bacterium]
MKTTFVTIIILAIALFFACKKEKEEKYWPLGNNWKGPQTYGKVQALRNGEFWEASGSASQVPYPTCGIIFRTFDPIDSVYTENLSFYRAPYTEGLFTVDHLHLSANDSLRSLYVLLYDDLAGPFFHPDTTKNNWIWIESVDTVQKIIKGKFDVTYRIDPSDVGNTNYPPEVHFSEGVFEVKVHQ